MNNTLDKLRTALGERSSYDAASQCSRCGYCEQACPTYALSGREAFSPRGRNQLFRMMLEGKLKEPASAQEALSTCLLCGACSTACYAHIPTPDIVLEGRRSARAFAPLWARVAAWLLERPRVLSAALRLAAALQRLGLSALAEALGRPLPRLPGRSFRSRDVEGPRGSWAYFAACGPNYLFPEAAQSSCAALEKSRGPGGLLQGCCGLISYNYGELEKARDCARRLIERFESSGAQDLVGDCSSCVAHLKAYPQLFLGDPAWLPRAEKFSARVRDFIELPLDAARRQGARTEEKITYHDSCRARHGQGLHEAPRRLLREAYAGSFVELPEADWCCGGAGAFSFLHPELSEEILRRKIDNIASTGARIVATSSTSCLLQLARGLKKYYPECRVLHLSQALAQRPR